jgi:K+-sensing histidine kinase KdpD
VLSDYVLPGFGGLAAIRLVQQKDPDLPLIIISGQIGEDTAVAAMKAGAQDYIIKGNLKRLGAAIERELAEAENRRQRKKAEEEVRTKEEELNLSRKMEALKDEFIGMVSHELKTPLTVIIGALSVAETEGISPEEAKELIHEAGISAEALAIMVDNLLELSRHQSNRLNLQTKQTQIMPVVQAVVQKLQHKSAIHRLTTDVPSDLPAAKIDPIRIERVLHNLVENAIKYSPKGGEVRIFGNCSDARLVIGVSDEGIGISPEDQPRLFKSFERLNASVKGAIQGTGLGLRVCQILVEAHDGRIWVESMQGKGSTFFFSLPVAETPKGQ